MSAAGIEEKQPRTDEEWKNVRHNAIRVIEATNLLMMDGRQVAKPGEKSDNPGIELQPQEIQDLINKDRPTFIKWATALRNAAIPALNAIDKRDPAALGDAGEQMDSVCENCHLKYWYPNGGPPPNFGTAVGAEVGIGIRVSKTGLLAALLTAAALATAASAQPAAAGEERHGHDQGPYPPDGEAAGQPDRPDGRRSDVRANQRRQARRERDRRRDD